MHDTNTSTCIAHAPPSTLCVLTGQLYFIVANAISASLRILPQYANVSSNRESLISQQNLSKYFERGVNSTYRLEFNIASNDIVNNY